MTAREFSADQCPSARLRNGGPLLEAWNGLRALLVPYFRKICSDTGPCSRA
ncbi:hypothetical protein [Komagataeibacter kakiaceti]